MSAISMKLLLEAGVHFGHQTNKWNPKMKPYIFGARNNIYIIDLQQTVGMFQSAYNFVVDTVSQGREILFVGTKKQSQEAIREEATRCGMPYVNQRWLGGMLTNFITIKKSIDRLNSLNKMFADDSVKAFPKKEITKLQKEMDKMETVLGGIKNMRTLPAAVFIVDPNRERITVQEAKKLKIPLVAIVDTNCGPTDIDYIIPGNDDAGTMSAWAVFSMMGFYPDCPGVPEYTLTDPTFDRITIRLNPEFYGKDKLIIEKKENGSPEGYIQKIELGGKKTGYRINHNDLVKGGTLTFYK